MKMPRLKTVLVVLKLTVSIALLALLFTRADMRTMWQQFRQMNLAWMVAALTVYGLVLGLSAWRWRLLLNVQTVDVGFSRLTQSFLVATFFNNFLPSNIGGDVVRVADTVPYTGSKTLAATVVLLDRVLGLVALLAVAAVASMIAVWSGIHLAGLGYVWATLVAGIVSLFVMLKRPAAISQMLLARMRRPEAGLVTRFQQLLETLDRFGREPREMWSAFAGAVAVQLLLVVFYLCAARSLSIPLPLLAASIIVPVSLAVQILPVSINGLGVREAVFAFFFTSLGLNVSSALTLSLGSAGLIMVFSLSGGAVLLLRGRRQWTSATIEETTS